MISDETEGSPPEPDLPLPHRKRGEALERAMAENPAPPEAAAETLLLAVFTAPAGPVEPEKVREGTEEEGP